MDKGMGVSGFEITKIVVAAIVRKQKFVTNARRRVEHAARTIQTTHFKIIWE
jgi:hypothetical protein